MAGMAIGGVGQVSRTVSSIGAAEAFWRDVVGAAHLYTYGDMAFFDLGGTRLYLQQGAAGPESILYLRVPDIGAAYLALEARGATFRNAPHMVHRHADGTEEWMAFLDDPDGRPLALMAQVKP